MVDRTDDILDASTDDTVTGDTGDTGTDTTATATAAAPAPATPERPLETILAEVREMVATEANPLLNPRLFSKDFTKNDILIALLGDDAFKPREGEPYTDSASKKAAFENARNVEAPRIQASQYIAFKKTRGEDVTPEAALAHVNAHGGIHTEDKSILPFDIIIFGGKEDGILKRDFFAKDLLDKILSLQAAGIIINLANGNLKAADVTKMPDADKVPNLQPMQEVLRTLQTNTPADYAAAKEIAIKEINTIARSLMWDYPKTAINLYGFADANIKTTTPSTEQKPTPPPLPKAAPAADEPEKSLEEIITTQAATIIEDKTLQASVTETLAAKIKELHATEVFKKASAETIKSIIELEYQIQQDTAFLEGIKRYDDTFVKTGWVSKSKTLDETTAGFIIGLIEKNAINLGKAAKKSILNKITDGLRQDPKSVTLNESEITALNKAFNTYEPTLIAGIEKNIQALTDSLYDLHTLESASEAILAEARSLAGDKQEAVEDLSTKIEAFKNAKTDEDRATSRTTLAASIATFGTAENTTKLRSFLSVALQLQLEESENFSSRIKALEKPIENVKGATTLEEIKEELSIHPEAFTILAALKQGLATNAAKEDYDLAIAYLTADNDDAATKALSNLAKVTAKAPTPDDRITKALQTISEPLGQAPAFMAALAAAYNKNRPKNPTEANQILGYLENLATSLTSNNAQAKPWAEKALAHIVTLSIPAGNNASAKKRRTNALAFFYYPGNSAITHPTALSLNAHAKKLRDSIEQQVKELDKENSIFWNYKRLPNRLNDFQKIEDLELVDDYLATTSSLEPDATEAKKQVLETLWAFKGATPEKRKKLRTIMLAKIQAHENRKFEQERNKQFDAFFTKNNIDPEKGRDLRAALHINYTNICRALDQQATDAKTKGYTPIAPNSKRVIDNFILNLPSLLNGKPFSENLAHLAAYVSDALDTKKHGDEIISVMRTADDFIYRASTHAGRASAETIIGAGAVIFDAREKEAAAAADAEAADFPRVVRNARPHAAPTLDATRDEAAAERAATNPETTTHPTIGQRIGTPLFGFFVNPPQDLRSESDTWRTQLAAHWPAAAFKFGGILATAGFATSGATAAIGGAATGLTGLAATASTLTVFGLAAPMLIPAILGGIIIGVPVGLTAHALTKRYYNGRIAESRGQTRAQFKAEKKADRKAEKSLKKRDNKDAYNAWLARNPSATWAQKKAEIARLTAQNISDNFPTRKQLRAFFNRDMAWKIGTNVVIGATISAIVRGGIFLSTGDLSTATNWGSSQRQGVMDAFKSADTGTARADMSGVPVKNTPPVEPSATTEDGARKVTTIPIRPDRSIGEIPTAPAAEPPAAARGISQPETAKDTVVTPPAKPAVTTAEPPAKPAAAPEAATKTEVAPAEKPTPTILNGDKRVGGSVPTDTTPPASEPHVTPPTTNPENALADAINDAKGTTGKFAAWVEGSPQMQKTMAGLTKIVDTLPAGAQKTRLLEVIAAAEKGHPWAVLGAIDSYGEGGTFNDAGKYTALPKGTAMDGLGARKALAETARKAMIDDLKDEKLNQAGNDILQNAAADRTPSGATPTDAPKGTVTALPTVNRASLMAGFGGRGFQTGTYNGDLYVSKAPILATPEPTSPLAQIWKDKTDWDCKTFGVFCGESPEFVKISTLPTGTSATVVDAMDRALPRLIDSGMTPEQINQFVSKVASGQLPAKVQLYMEAEHALKQDKAITASQRTAALQKLRGELELSIRDVASIDPWKTKIRKPTAHA